MFQRLLAAQEGHISVELVTRITDNIRTCLVLHVSSGPVVQFGRRLNWINAFLIRDANYFFPIPDYSERICTGQTDMHDKADRLIVTKRVEITFIFVWFDVLCSRLPH
jgi:hypothetical protein